MTTTRHSTYCPRYGGDGICNVCAATEIFAPGQTLIHKLSGTTWAYRGLAPVITDAGLAITGTEIRAEASDIRGLVRSFHVDEMQAAPIGCQR